MTVDSSLNIDDKQTTVVMTTLNGGLTPCGACGERVVNGPWIVRGPTQV